MSVTILGTWTALAGCLGTAPTYEPVEVVEGAQDEIEPLPGEVPPPSTESDVVLPAAVLGTFDVDREACRDPVSPTRVVVRNVSLGHVDGVASFENIDVSEGVYTIESTFVSSEGGEPEPRHYTIAPAAPEGPANGLRIGRGTVTVDLVPCP